MQTLTKQAPYNIAISYEEMAVNCWIGNENGLRDFQKYAALSEQPAAYIAMKIIEAGGTCSPDKVEKHINAYNLYIELVAAFPRETELIRDARRQLSPTHWTRAVELRNTFDLSAMQILEHILDAVGDRPSVAAFAAHVDSIYNKTPMWIRKLTKLAEYMTGFFLKDYAGEIPPGKRAEIEAIFDEAAEKLERVVKDDKSP